jgi:hypothetical protein
LPPDGCWLSLILICFGLLCLLIHRDAITPLWISRDFHLPPQRSWDLYGLTSAVEPAERGSHLGLDLRSPSGHSPHRGIQPRMLQRPLHPEVSPHQNIAEISHHHQNNYGLNIHKPKPRRQTNIKVFPQP